MAPDRQKVRTDGMDGRRQNYIPPTSSGDNNVFRVTGLKILGRVPGMRTYFFYLLFFLEKKLQFYAF